MGKWLKSCQITKNLIKLDLIMIIQFCLKIYDLWTYSPPMGGCMGGRVVIVWVRVWGHVESLKIE